MACGAYVVVGPTLFRSACLAIFLSFMACKEVSAGRDQCTGSKPSDLSRASLRGLATENSTETTGSSTNMSSFKNASGASHETDALTIDAFSITTSSSPSTSTTSAPSPYLDATIKVVDSAIGTTQSSRTFQHEGPFLAANGEGAGNEQAHHGLHLHSVSNSVAIQVHNFVDAAQQTTGHNLSASHMDALIEIQRLKRQLSSSAENEVKMKRQLAALSVEHEATLQQQQQHQQEQKRQQSMVFDKALHVAFNTAHEVEFSNQYKMYSHPPVDAEDAELDDPNPETQDKVEDWKSFVAHLQRHSLGYGSFFGILLWFIFVLFFYCCGGHQKITGGSVGTAFLVYVVYMPMHFARTFSDSPKLASQWEGDHLHAKMHLFSRNVIDFVARRRSIMVVVLLFAIAVTIVQVEEFIFAFNEIEKYEHWADVQPLNYTEFALTHKWNETDPNTFMKFTKYAGRGMTGSILSSTAIFTLLGEGLEALCGFLSMVCTGLALKNWDQFHISFRRMRLAWLFSLLAPFCITIIPMRQFMDWKNVNYIAMQYSNELDAFSGEQTGKVAQQALEGCMHLSNFRQSGALKQAADAALGVCQNLRKFTPDKHVKCCKVIKIIDAPFDVMHANCRKVQAELMGHVDTIEATLQMAETGVCVAFRNDMMKIASEGGDGRGAWAKAYEDQEKGNETTVEYLVQNSMFTGIMKQAVKYGIALGTGLKCFNAMMPAAVAIAPSLIRGALIVKRLVPQANLPGMFIVLLPWLYCPFVWSVYTIVYQLVGSNEAAMWLFPGLLVLAFGPMTYSVGGVILNIQKPMADDEAKVTFGRLGRITLLVSLMGYACLAAFAYTFAVQELGAFLEGKTANQLTFLLLNSICVNTLVIAKMFVNTIHKYFLTTCAGIDFMVEQIADQWKFELGMERHEMEFEKNEPLWPQPESEDKQASQATWESEESKRQMAVERVERMDCLVWLRTNSMEDIVENSRAGSKVKCREHYLPPGGAFYYTDHGFGTATTWDGQDQTGRDQPSQPYPDNEQYPPQQYFEYPQDPSQQYTPQRSTWPQQDPSQQYPPQRNTWQDPSEQYPPQQYPPQQW